ncbi:MAG TPA: hypothetical protein VMZ69_07030 [Saprospiraceae bacterium]|nr:hypothetical protein [Saprospiraceae bacterium]
MNKKRFFPCICLITGIALISSCTLDEPNSSNFVYPITLQAHQDYSLITLSWTPVNTTDFKEYIILQSSQEIPESPEPVISADVAIVKRIDDSDITSFLTSDIRLSPNVCYKVYASIGDRFLQSSSICVQQDFNIISGFYDRVAHENGLDEIVMFDRVNQRMSTYNYNTEVITNSLNESFFSFPILEISTYSGTTNAFAFDQSPPRLRKYSFPELEASLYKDFSAVLFAAKTYNQYIFASVEEWGNSFKVLNRSNFNEVDTEEGLLGNRNIAVFPGDPLIVLEVGDQGMIKYNIDSNGKITKVDSKTIGVVQPGTQNTTAQGTELFIAGRQGDVLDRNGNKVGALTNSLNSFVFMSRLSEDEKKVAYVVSDNVNVRLEIADISNPAHISRLTSFNVPNANYADLIIDDEVLYLIGVSFDSGQAQTFILKYPMP